MVKILYVNNLIILVRNVTQLKWHKSELKNEFKMDDHGKLHCCLGVKLEKKRKVIPAT